MANPVPMSQRLMSLANYLSMHEGGASTIDIERDIEGYDGLACGEEGVVRMFNRDLAALNNPEGSVVKDGDLVRIDPEKFNIKSLELSDSDCVCLALAGTSALEDPSFPFHAYLRSALVSLGLAAPNLSRHLGKGSAPQASRTVSPDPGLRLLFECQATRKRVRFKYEKEGGDVTDRTVEPCSLFAIDGEFYLLARDIGTPGYSFKPDPMADPQTDPSVREFKLSRMKAIKRIDGSHEPDFPARNIQARDFQEFPFAFGPEKPFKVAFLIPKGSPKTPKGLWSRSAAIFQISGQSDFELMLAVARSARRAAQWAYQHSPETVPVAPQEVRDLFMDGLARLARWGEADDGKAE